MTERKLRLIIGMAIATFVVGVILYVMKGPQKSKIGETENLVRVVGLQVERFKSICGHYPSSEQGLRALKEKPEGEPSCPDWSGPYASEDFVDAWGHMLFYSSDTKMFDLRSFGADAKIGGSGNDADVVFTPERSRYEDAFMVPSSLNSL